MDNTLWDFEKNSREALLHLFVEHEIEKQCNTNFNDFTKVYEAINHDLWHQYSLKKTTKTELRYQRFYKSFLHFNFDKIELAHSWADDYLKISPYKTHLIEDAIEVLDYLHHKYDLHIITNGFKEVQHIKLDSSNLKPFFKQIIISEEHGYNKPDVKIFELAQTLAVSDKEACVMIGDNYDADIIGSLNAGWKSIYLSNIKIENLNTNFIQISKLKQLLTIF